MFSPESMYCTQREQLGEPGSASPQQPELHRRVIQSSTAERNMSQSWVNGSSSAGERAAEENSFFSQLTVMFIVARKTAFGSDFTVQSIIQDVSVRQ